jgi:hypothetical protein
MSAPPNTVYLERRTYRRRRMMDAARLLPVLGVLLFLVPLLWAPDPAEPAATSRGVIYIFAVWAGLIAAAAWISRYLARSEAGTSGQEQGR